MHTDVFHIRSAFELFILLNFYINGSPAALLLKHSRSVKGNVCVFCRSFFFSTIISFILFRRFIFPRHYWHSIRSFIRKLKRERTETPKCIGADKLIDKTEKIRALVRLLSSVHFAGGPTGIHRYPSLAWRTEKKRRRKPGTGRCFPKRDARCNVFAFIPELGPVIAPANS